MLLNFYSLSNHWYNIWHYCSGHCVQAVVCRPFMFICSNPCQTWHLFIKRAAHVTACSSSMHDQYAYTTLHKYLPHHTYKFAWTVVVCECKISSSDDDALVLAAFILCKKKQKKKIHGMWFKEWLMKILIQISVYWKRWEYILMIVIITQE